MMRPLIWVSALVLSLAAGAQPAPADLSVITADFPASDYAIGIAERTGMAIRAASGGQGTPATQIAGIGALMSRGRDLEAFSAAKAIVSSDPAHMIAALQAFTSTSLAWREDERGNRAQLQELMTIARRHLANLPAEDAARAARRMIDLDGIMTPRDAAARIDALRAFVDQYPGTEEALLTQVDLIGATMRPTRPGGGAAYIEALDAFIGAHPGTTAAAKALNVKGGLLRSSNTFAVNEPRGSDPTDRFMKVFAIVDELESGTYPPCDWVAQAPSLVFNFFSYEPTYAPVNLDRMIAGYRRFAATHFVVDDRAPFGNAIGYVITSKVGELYKLKGDEPGGVLQLLTDLEGTVKDPSAVRYLEALYYATGFQGLAPAADRPRLLQVANERLLALSKDVGGRYAQKALSTLAAQQLYNRDYQGAVSSYRAYLSSYPQSPWAWVAGIRMGQAQAALGEWRAARATFRNAATIDAIAPMARVIGNTYAGQASEALGEFGVATDYFEKALAAWDADFAAPAFDGPVYEFETRYNTAAPGDRATAQSTSVAKADLTARTTELKDTLQFPGGDLIERGRWLLGQGQWDAARATLEDAIARYPRSSLVPLAKRLTHEARLNRAMALADIEASTHDDAAAMKELEALSTEAPDFSVVGASIVRAAILWKQGAQTEARSIMKAALETWRNIQPHASTAQQSGLDTDVRAIRDAVFSPTGGQVLSVGHWNAFQFPRALPPYLVVPSTVIVKLPIGEVQRRPTNVPIAGLDDVLFLDREQLRFLTTVMQRIGGTATRAPRAVMETPNQPIGPAVDLLALFNEFFPARPGHWGGWEFETYPQISRIEFLDGARTKALANVTVGYSGATVVLEKRDGVWVALRLTNQWIT